jgi:imidazoleglycerol-phosphate dehydratase / histidinol-phosphatase
VSQKVLFIDRDGTLALEPKDYQLDALDKLEFYPGVFQFLGRIAKEMDYELVMVTNQDGLGTASFPEDSFWPTHDFMLTSLKNEGVAFNEIFIDKSLPEDNAPTRKPKTGMLTAYLNNADYDLENSYVIGDRLSDMQLAQNLGAKGILLQYDERMVEEISDEIKPVIALQTHSWESVYTLLKAGSRSAVHTRTTKETDINIELNLDGAGQSNIDTGIAFFDHMLDQLARHGGIDIVLTTKGDLEVDEHHTIEDTAIALGEAFAMALGTKLGMERYGFCLPMDDCLAQVAIDFGGRAWLMWDAKFKRELIGKMPTEMFFHFFKSFADGAKANLNIKAEGHNEHHKIEAIFKAFAKAIKMAIKRDAEKLVLPSTKGQL